MRRPGRHAGLQRDRDDAAQWRDDQLGVSLEALIVFLTVALVIYLLVVVPMNRLKGPAAVETKACAECTSERPLGARRCPFCTQPQHVA